MARRDGMEASASQPNAVAHPQGDHDEAESAEYAILVGRTVAEVERELILETLRRCHGNRTHAANILGISIRTLRNKLHEYADEGVAIPPAGSAGEIAW
jgi:DNA-binding NtrC family response regulator